MGKWGEDVTSHYSRTRVVHELIKCGVAGGSDKSLCLWHAETGA